MKACDVTLAVVCVAMPVWAAAQPVQGPYVSLGGGVSFLQDEIFKPYGSYGPDRRTYSFDPGAAAAASIGYGLGNGLRLEAEGDYANNHVSDVKLQTPERAGGYQQQFGGFLNAFYDIGLDLPVVPYVGIGVGYQDIELDNVNSSVPGRRIHSTGTEDEGTFAYQAMAGLSYAVDAVPGLSLTAEYRLIGVLTPPPFDRGPGPGDIVFQNGVQQAYRSTVNNIFNHQILLGLRYAFDTAPPPPVATPAAVAAPAPAPARSYLVFFDWDRADLTERARQIVAEAAAASTRVQTTRIEVDGHTDLSGTAAYNQRLSLRRAQAVAAELMRDGVPSAAIAVRGLGEANPLVPTAAGVREPQNRRVEIVLR